MTSREARTERREAERKAKKTEIKRNKAIACEALDLEDEFSPELIAEANAARAEVSRKIGVDPRDEAAILSEPKTQTIDFVSHSAPPPIKRAETNRLNSLHSTGPKSADGKMASSRNSLKHGLASGTVVIPGEDPAAFEALLRGLSEEHQPASPTEALLVQEMAQSHWLGQRALRLQNDCFTADGVDEKRLSLFLRYQATHSRTFHKALNTMMKLQKERRRGFVSQRAPQSLHESGFVSQNSTPSDEFVWQNAPSSRESAETLLKSEAA